MAVPMPPCPVFVDAQQPPCGAFCEFAGSLPGSPLLLPPPSAPLAPLAKMSPPFDTAGASRTIMPPEPPPPPPALLTWPPIAPAPDASITPPVLMSIRLTAIRYSAPPLEPPLVALAAPLPPGQPPRSDCGRDCLAP